MVRVLVYPCKSKKSMIVVNREWKEEVLGYGELANGALQLNLQNLLCRCSNKTHNL